MRPGQPSRGSCRVGRIRTVSGGAGRRKRQPVTVHGWRLWWSALLGLALTCLLAVPASASTPAVVPSPQAPSRTPTLPLVPRQRPPDLSAPLPVVSPTPTPVTPTATPEVLPATLTPTPIPPTATPTATPVVLVVLPTATPQTPTPTATPEADGLLLPEGAVPGEPGPVALEPPVEQALPAPPPVPPPASRLLGLPEEPGAGGWFAPDVLWLGVPSRTQFDGTPYAAVNCGPSALGMILEAYGLWMPTHDLRLIANALQGTWGYNDGIALDYLAEIGSRAGLKPLGLYDGERSRYHRWTVDEVRQAVLNGYPVIVLTKYRLLPGNGAYGGSINHYIVISGVIGDDFLYNDSAFGGSGARALIISAQQLEAAWATADIPRHAVAFALGEERLGLVAPSTLVAGRGGSVQPPVGTRHEALARALAQQARGRAAGSAAGVAAVSPPPDPVTAHRRQLLDDVVSPAALLDAPLLGASTTAALAPSVVSPAFPVVEPPALDALQVPEMTAEPPEPVQEASVTSGSLALLGGGVGGVYLLLLVRGLVGRWRRDLTH